MANTDDIKEAISKAIRDSGVIDSYAKSIANTIVDSVLGRCEEKYVTKEEYNNLISIKEKKYPNHWFPVVLLISGIVALEMTNGASLTLALMGLVWGVINIVKTISLSRKDRNEN